MLVCIRILLVLKGSPSCYLVHSLSSVYTSLLPVSSSLRPSLPSIQAAFFNEERDIMALATSPWLTSLHYAFQDPISLYLVMDFHPGGDLLTVMERRDGGMSEEETRYVHVHCTVGTILISHFRTLTYLHSNVRRVCVLWPVHGVYITYMYMWLTLHANLTIIIIYMYMYWHIHIMCLHNVNVHACMTPWHIILGFI